MGPGNLEDCWPDARRWPATALGDIAGGLCDVDVQAGAKFGQRRCFGKYAGENAGENAGCGAGSYATGVIQGAAFPQKLRAEDDVVAVQLRSNLCGVAHRHGRFDNHHRLWVDGHHVLNHRFYRLGVEVVGVNVVVGRRGDDDKAGTGIGVYLVQRGAQAQRLVRQVVFQLSVFNGALLAVKQGHFVGVQVNAHHFVVLGQQNGVGQAYVAQAGDGDFHGKLLFFC